MEISEASGGPARETAIIYAVVFAGLLALSYYARPACYSADYYLEKKISWWWRIAEMRRPAPVIPAATGQPTATAPRQRDDGAHEAA